MVLRFKLVIAVFFALVCCLKVYSQKDAFVQQIKKLPIELRQQFIFEKSKELFEGDTLLARKEINATLTYFNVNSLEYAALLESKALYLMRSKKHEASIEILKQIQNIYVNLNNIDSEINIFNKICDNYFSLNEVDKAMELLFKKLKLVEGDDYKEFLVLVKIGVLFKEIKNYPKAMEYLILAEEKMYRINSSSETIVNAKLSLLKNLGVLYRNKDDFTKAIFYFSKGYALADQADNTKYKGIILNSLGILYKETKQYDKAIATYEESLLYKKENNNLAGLSNTYNNLGDLYLILKNSKKAKEYYLLSYDIAIKSKSQSAVSDANKGMFNLYDFLGDYKTAYPYLKRAYQLQDSVYSTNSAEESARLESIYNNEKKQKEIEISKIKTQNLERSIASKNKERNLFIFSALILALLLTLSVRSYLQKRKVNELLSINNKLINDQKLLVEEKQKEILDSIQYAKKIQTSQLANDTYIAKTLERLLKKD